MKKTHIIALIVIAAAISAIMMAVGDTSTYVTFAKAEMYPQKDFHVIGVLDREQEIYYDPQVNPNFFSFYMKDEEGQVRKVVYHDAKPQDFERSEKVVVVGRSGEGEFEAKQILMKCPSKYKEGGEQEWMEASS